MRSFAKKAGTAGLSDLLRGCWKSFEPCRIWKFDSNLDGERQCPPSTAVPNYTFSIILQSSFQHLRSQGRAHPKGKSSRTPISADYHVTEVRRSKHHKWKNIAPRGLSSSRRTCAPESSHGWNRRTCAVQWTIDAKRPPCIHLYVSKMHLELIAMIND